MVTPISLTPEEQKNLRRQARRAVGRVAERIHYVLLFARGYPVEEIATLYQVDARTINAWLERYRHAGVDGLDDLPRSGRPRLATAAAQAEAIHCLEGSPRETGEGRTTWTRRLLGRHLGERFDCWLSGSSVTRLIHRNGFGWRRPKLTVKATDPEQAARLAAIDAAVAAHPAAPRLYEDECDLHQLPVVRGQYQRRGEQREIPTPGTNCKQPVFGFLNVRDGEWHYWLTARKRSVEFVTCLHAIEQIYSTGPILLFLDNGSIHKSKLTRRWLANHSRFRVYYLPSYSGHQTNPVEKVWWALKAECAADYLYESREAVQDAIHAFFSTFSRKAALRLVARHTEEQKRPKAAQNESQLTQALPLAA
jgi:putative transposase